MEHDITYEEEDISISINLTLKLLHFVIDFHMMEEDVQ